MLLTVIILQGHLSSSPRLPLETRARLRHNHTFPPSDHHFLLLSFCAHKLALVESPGGKRYPDDIVRDMELSMARVAADDIRC
jgi:hypothetical protein